MAEGANADARKKFVARSALAIIVLASLLYLLGEPENPGAVWTRLEEQFQRKTWANKLYAQRTVNDHIKMMTEIFEELAVIGDAVSESGAPPSQSAGII